jgi:D-alanyl-D-alanine carboxypeptidase/D-alanyl-D-alanine-endopeptidase (penicillin-binding protein 4)
MADLHPTFLRPSNLLRLVWLSAALVLLVGATTADASVAEQRLERAVGAQVRAAGGASGAWVADLDTGVELFSHYPDRKRTPASVQKLFTTATVLARLGPQVRLETAVSTNGVLDAEGTLVGRLYIRGFGDPSFGSARLARLAEALRAAGLRSLTGGVYGDESFFDSRRGVPASGFAVSPWIGPLSALAFNRGLGLSGRFQRRPAPFVAARLRSLLAARDIDVEGPVRAARTPAGSLELASVDSAPIENLVRHTNQVSDNYFAEVLLKGLGARLYGTGSTAAGAGVVRRFQRKLDAESAVVDGSGLSRANAASPRAVGHLLARVENEPWFESFYRSLPLAGRSGTLRKRMRRTSAQGRCRAKTGTLIGVSALAGYCRSITNRRLAFVLLMNRVNVYSARRAQDRVAATLASYRG